MCIRDRATSACPRRGMRRVKPWRFSVHTAGLPWTHRTIERTEGSRSKEKGEPQGRAGRLFRCALALAVNAREDFPWLTQLGRRSGRRCATAAFSRGQAACDCRDRCPKLRGLQGFDRAAGRSIALTVLLPPRATIAGLTWQETLLPTCQPPMRP